MGPVYWFPMAPGVSQTIWKWPPLTFSAAVKFTLSAPSMVENRAPMGTSMLNTPSRTAGEAGYRLTLASTAR